MNKKTIKYVTEIIRCPDFDGGEFLAGTLVHEAYSLRLKENGYEVNKLVYKVFGDVLLIGRVDAINDEEVVEIKTGKNPNLLWMLQLGIYMNLARRDTGRLVMIFDDVREYRLDEPLSDDAIVALIKDERRPKWRWECQKCRRKSSCPYI